MPATEIPGLSTILAWAAFLDMDVSDTVRKLLLLRQSDPNALWTGADELNGVLNGLNSGGHDIGHGMAETVATGANGQMVDMLGGFHAGLETAVAGAGELAARIQTTLGDIGNVFSQSQHVAMVLTGSTATALRTLAG